MLIKAGTYRFDDTIQTPIVNTETPISFTFSDGYGSGWHYMVLGTNYISYATKLDGNYAFAYQTNGTWITSRMQTIKVPEDSEVDDTFATWFTDNTHQVDLTGTTWYVPSGWSATAGYGKFNVLGNFNSYSIDELWLGYNQYSPEQLVKNTLLIHTVEGTALFSASFEEFTLTITGGTDATNPALIAWLSENGELQGTEEETPIFPAVEITYKDKVITLKAGQTATLHIKDHKLTEDLVIKANEVETLEPNLGEATFTERRVYTAEDDFLDGYSKVTVAVPHTPKEVVLESQMTALLETADVGSVYKYKGETTDTYESGALYIVEAVSE